MTHRKRKLLAAYLDDEHIGKGNYIEDLEKAENYLHRALRGEWRE